MRFKLFTLAAVAALATAMPARATIVLEWHMSTNQANPNYVTGPNLDATSNLEYDQIGVVGPAVAGNSLTLNPGQSVILQAVLHQIDNTGPNVLTYQPGGGGGLIAYGVRIDNSAPTVATHFQPSNSNANTRGVGLYGFNGGGTTIVTGGAGAAGTAAAFTIVRDLTTGDWYNSDNFYPLFNFRFTAGSGGGSGTLQFVDPQPGGADIGSVATPNMDAGIFGSAPALTFAVVPEPSSMVLCGLGLAGLGIRLRRKKVAKEEAAA